MKPSSFKGDNEDAAIYVKRTTAVRNLLFYVHTLNLDNRDKNASIACTVSPTKLRIVHSQGQKR